MRNLRLHLSWKYLLRFRAREGVKTNSRQAPHPLRRELEDREHGKKPSPSQIHLRRLVGQVRGDARLQRGGIWWAGHLREPPGKHPEVQPVRRDRGEKPVRKNPRMLILRTRVGQGPEFGAQHPRKGTRDRAGTARIQAWSPTSTHPLRVVQVNSMNQETSPLVGRQFTPLYTAPVQTADNYQIQKPCCPYCHSLEIEKSERDEGGSE